MDGFRRLQATFATVLATLALAAGVAAADQATYDDVFARTNLISDGPRSDSAYSDSNRRHGGASMGVKNTYQEFFNGLWRNIRTVQDMDSGSYAYATQTSPVPSTCRNGRFIGDHYSGSTKRGSTLVDPPADNCP